MTPVAGLPIAPPPLPTIGGQQPNLPAGAQPFKNVLVEALEQVNAMQSQANQAVEQLVTGGDVNPAEVLTTLQKADMSFRMMLQIRNKLLQAYQEINNIRI
ncbi:MAG TPA: flagellar hook-basal body complex protein FliE [Pirellulaceae bacterium]|nr:flagellar hook-basal body complex protein FliE [Pirellulaceae bacterium]